MPGLNNNSANLGSFCRAIGLIYDRTSSSTEPICSTFLVTERKVTTLASLMLPFAKNPEGVKVVFPHSEKEFGVSNIHFHEKFDRNLKRKTLFQGTLGNGPEAALQKFNCCVLDLTDGMQPISEMQVEQVSQSLRYPLNLTDEGFRGSLTEIELPLVIQTLNNAKKQGILYICDELHRPLAQIYCAEGRIIAAKYRSLLNEMAIFQIVEKRLSGRFLFRACKPPAWLPAQTIQRTTDMILIEAMRRQDEITNLREQLRINDYYLVRAYKQLYLDGISHENRQAAEMIWRALDGTTPADQLWSLVPLDDHTIFSALLEMYMSNQCMRVPLSGTMQFAIPKPPSSDAQAPAFWAPTPLPLGTLLQLNAFDTISSVSIDPLTSKPRVKVGALLGAIDPYDAEHLLHDIPLLPSSSGSPLIKDDLVIGMHCGVVPTSSALDNPFGVLQQMLWCDAVAQVLLTIPGIVVPPPVPLTAPEPSTQSFAPNAQALSPGSGAGQVYDEPNAYAPTFNPSASATRMQAADPNASGTRFPPAQNPTNSATRLPAADPNSSATRLPPADPNNSATRMPAATSSMAPPSGVSAAASQAAGIEQSQFDTKKRRALEASAKPTVSLPQGPPGCREIASLKCAICGERTFSSARRCTRCLHEFVPQLKSQASTPPLDLVVPIAALLLVALAASAAYAWARLPTPVYQNVDIMTIPKVPWVDTAIEAGKKNHTNGVETATWEPQPDGAKLPVGTYIHLRCKVNKRSHLRLMLKGSGGASEVNLDVDTPAQGSSITFPPTTSVVGPKDAPLNLFAVGGPPGADEFILIANSNNTEFPMLQQSDMLDEVFNKANNMLKMAKSKTGIVVFGSQLMPKAKANEVTDNNQYFINSATVYH